jgi:hypothetical protein
VAERRKLEAELYESRESLNDTYYDHAKDAQNEALDAEAQAYEETMTKMVEGMRTSLQEATLEMDNFLNSVTIAVSMNADSVLAKYQDTELYLNPALTNPWIAAKNAVGQYGGDATKLMDVWKADGYFAEFSSQAGINLSSPWYSGKIATEVFGTSVGATMASVYKSVQSNVQNSIIALDQLKQKYKEINDITVRAPSTGGGVGAAAFNADEQIGNIEQFLLLLSCFHGHVPGRADCFFYCFEGAAFVLDAEGDDRLGCHGLDFLLQLFMADCLAAKADDDDAVDVGVAGEAGENLLAHVGVGLNV